MIPHLLVALCLCATIRSDPARLHGRDSCHSTGYTRCSPDATATNAPGIGNSLSGLYVDLLDSVNKVQNTKRDDNQYDDIAVRSSASSICCAEGTKCLALQDYELPFCYDKFTTNYFLPGGAYGQIVSGNYASSEGEANLLNGTYTLSNGTSGSIATPDTATLTVPTQYTASGVGSAIPVTALGEWTTFTTTIPGTTIPPETIAAHVLAPSVVSGSTVEPAITEAATTAPASTVAPKTSVITTKVAKASSTSTSKAATVNGGNSVLSKALVVLFVLVCVCLQ